MQLNENEKMLLAVAKRIPETLREEIVFVGGAIISLSLSEKILENIRVTEDIDFIVNSQGAVAFNRFEEELRKISFKQVVEEGAPICRWRIDEILVDVMPCDQNIFGFSNKWYKKAIENYNEISLEDVKVKIAKPEYLLATKIEAFLGRGKNDFLVSHDMEDIITLIDGRSELFEEIKAADDSLKEYLIEVFKGWLENSDFIDSIPGHLRPDAASQARYEIILDRLQKITEI
jgi:predicted nucleotidyltransferase